MLDKGILANTMTGNDKHLVVIFGDDAAGSLAVIDLATDKVTHQAPPKCP